MDDSGNESSGPQYHDEHVSHGLPDGHPDKPSFSMGVLIAVDESSIAEAAFKWYVEHIHRREYHVTVFNAAEPPRMQAGVGLGFGAAFPVDEWQACLEQKRQDCKTLQLKYAKLMRETKIHGKVTVFWSDNAGHGIDAYVKGVNTDMDKQSINLIIIGSRGHGKIRRTFLGSVSSYVLHHTHVPIVVAPPPRHGQHK